MMWIDLAASVVVYYQVVVYQLVSSCVRNVHLAFANLRHLCRRRDNRLLIIGRVCMDTLRSVLLYASETSPLRAEVLVFEYQCPHIIGTLLIIGSQ